MGRIPLLCGCALAAANALAAPFAYAPDDRQKMNVIDLATNRVVTQITVESAAIGVAAGVSANRLYVSDWATNTLQVIDTSNNATVATLDVCSAPYVPALNPAGTKLVVPCAGAFLNPSFDVMVIDTSTFAKTTITAGGPEPAAALWDAAGARFYVTGTDSVTVFDGSSLARIATISVPPGAFGTAINAAGTRLYVASSLNTVTGVGANVLTVIDAASRSTIATTSLPGGSSGIAIDPAGTHVFVTLPDSDAVAVLDANGQMLATVAMPQGSRPYSVAVHPDGSRAYVQLFSSGTLATLQAPSYALTASVTYGSKGATWGNFIGAGSSTVGPNAPGYLTGVWWNPNESGWGLSLVKRRNTIFGAWFTYDIGGSPTWHVSTCAMATPQVCFGPLLQVTGTRFFDPGGFDARFAEITQSGAMFLTFTDSGHGTMQYSVGDTTRAVAIERQPISNQGAIPAVNYTDLWWNPGESGWGIHITQQRNTMFLAWYVYDDRFKPMWYVATCTMNAAGNGCSAQLLRTTGPSIDSAFDPTDVRVYPVGTIAVTFTGPDSGVLTYTVDGVSGTKPITRQIF